MIAWITWLAAPLVVLGVGLLLPTISEFVSLLRRPWWSPAPSPQRSQVPRLAFTVFAHDEELLVAGTIRSLLAQRYPADRRDIIVVADNCSDRTADVARAEGVDVWERSDATRRGKPYAMAWAIERLPLAEYDGVVIIDADTAVAPDFATRLAERAPLRDKVLQPVIAVRNPDETAITRMAYVHGTAAHGLAYRVKERARLNVPLGVGMCLGTDVLRAEPWRAFSIAEDWELYCILTERGVRIEPVEAAKIGAQEAKSLAQSAPQRHRWLAGKIDVLTRYLGPILRSPHIGFPQKLDAAAELLAPGPAVHLGAGVVGAVLAFVIGGPVGLLAGSLLLASLVRPVAYTLAAIVVDPSPLAAVRAFAYLPIYTGWRLSSALKSVVAARTSRWVRTERHAVTDET